MGGLRAQLDRPLLTECLGDFWEADFEGLFRLGEGVIVLFT